MNLGTRSSATYDSKTFRESGLGPGDGRGWKDTESHWDCKQKFGGTAEECWWEMKGKWEKCYRKVESLMILSPLLTWKIKKKNELDDLIKNIPDRVLKLPSGFF